MSHIDVLGPALRRTCRILTDSSMKSCICARNRTSTAFDKATYLATELPHAFTAACILESQLIAPPSLVSLSPPMLSVYYPDKLQNVRVHERLYAKSTALLTVRDPRLFLRAKHVAYDLQHRLFMRQSRVEPGHSSYRARMSGRVILAVLMSALTASRYGK